jgi:protein-disulfide isomerase
MRNAIVLGSFGVAASFAMLMFGYLAGSVGPQAIASPQSAAAAAGLDRAAIEAIVREYLVENPEVLVEAQEVLTARQEEAKKVAQLETIRASSAAIFDAAWDGVVGNPDGKITIVEFFDYNCGFCKRAMPDMDKLIGDNPDVRFVMKEFPILGPDSQRAANVSMAFHKLKPDTYGEFNRKLLGSSGRATEAAAIKLAVSLGVDEAALREAMKDPAIKDAVALTYDLANDLSITGTPSYVIGEEVVFGAIGHQILQQKIADAREASGS